MTWAERYATDPVFHAKEFLRSKGRHKRRRADPAQREKQNAWRTRKYHADAEHRRTIIDKANAWQQAHRAHKKDYYLQRIYGITLSQFKELLAQQGGVCLLCGLPPRGKKNMAVDHDHVTGRVRGILHISCNTVLNRCFRDNPENMHAAAERFANAGLRS